MPQRTNRYNLRSKNGQSSKTTTKSTNSKNNKNNDESDEWLSGTSYSMKTPKNKKTKGRKHGSKSTRKNFSKQKRRRSNNTPNNTPKMTAKEWKQFKQQQKNEARQQKREKKKEYEEAKAAILKNAAIAHEKAMQELQDGYEAKLLEKDELLNATLIENEKLNKTKEKLKHRVDLRDETIEQITEKWCDISTNENDDDYIWCEIEEEYEANATEINNGHVIFGLQKHMCSPCTKPFTKSSQLPFCVGQYMPKPSHHPTNN
eukprot:346915_1